MRRLTLLLVAVLATVAALLYATRLGEAPPYLMHDESKFALQSISIATSGRDLSGRLLPVFFTEVEFPAGRDPAVIYLTAAALTWLPVSEANVRLPIALLGVVNVVLMFLVARRLFGRDWIALVAAAMLAFTPAHFIRSRLILSPQTSIPIVLAWLLCVAAFSEQPTRRRLAAAAAWLGAGFYTYLACVVMMPLYWLLTAWLAYRWLGRRALVVAAVAFALPVVPMAIWYVTHPERMSQIVGAYDLGKEVSASASAAVAGQGSVRKAVGLYWAFFSPEYLFISGDASLINSTRSAGLFPLSFALLMPLGILQAVKRQRPIDLVVLAGFLTAPLAAIASGGIEMNRVLFVLPFGVLIAVYGVEWLASAKARAWKVAAIIIVVAVPMQFAGFYRDYMGRYRIDSANAFGGNTRELFAKAVDRAGDGREARVLVSRTILFSDRYWRFYALEAQRPELIDRMEPYGPDVPATAPTGTLLLCRVTDSGCARLSGADEVWQPVHVVNELDGSQAFAVFEAR